MERSEIARLSGLFAAGTAEPATEAPHRKTAPIAPGDSLLDILMGLDSVISKQRERQSEAEGAEAPAPPPLQSDERDPPPLQMDLPRPASERGGPPPLQAEPPLQADWQAEIQQRHSVSRQALQVQALLRGAGWQGADSGPQPESDQGHTQPEAQQEEEPRCREARQYAVPHGGSQHWQRRGSMTSTFSNISTCQRCTCD